MDIKETESNKPKTILQVSPDFFSEYANNAYLQGSAWDLTIVFGQLNQKFEPAVADWFGQVTMPWAQAKILSYILRMHIIAHELQNGKISIPKSVLPQGIPDPTPEEIQRDPMAPEVVKKLQEIHAELVASL